MRVIRTAVVSLAALIASAVAAAAFPATATTSLNVRAGPGTNHRIVDTLQAGDTVEVTRQSGNWYQLSSGGWASASFLESGGVAVAPRRRVYRDYYYDDSFYDFWDDRPYWYWRPHRPRPPGWHRPPHRPPGWHRPGRPRPPGWNRPDRPRPPGAGRPDRPRPPGAGRPDRPRPPGAGRPDRPRPGGGGRPGMGGGGRGGGGEMIRPSGGRGSRS